MPVFMKGGTSGNREDARAKIDESFDRAVPQDTAFGMGIGTGNPNVVVPMGRPDNRAIPNEHASLPLGGTNPILTTERFGPDSEGLRCIGGAAGDSRGQDYCPDMPTSGTPGGGPI
jgi:hypothetical protein